MNEAGILQLAFSEDSLGDLWMSREMFEERLEWFRRAWKPEYVHCDDLERADEILSIPDGRWLSVDDAVRLMNAVDVRNPYRYTRIAIEKMIVIRTLYPNGLPKDAFSVGLCYYGHDRQFHPGMNPKTVREILLSKRWSPRSRRFFVLAVATTATEGAGAAGMVTPPHP